MAEHRLCGAVNHDQAGSPGPACGPRGEPRALGVLPVELEKGFQEALGVKEGVVVSDVTAGKAAEKAGVQRLDVITSVDGKPISRPEELVESIAGHKAGDVVKLVVVRDRKSRKYWSRLAIGKTLEIKTNRTNRKRDQLK